MAFGQIEHARQGQPTAEINMIPLIDVMLVLLVIFMITAPMLTHAVKIELPKAAATPNITKTSAIQVSINRSGDLFWDGKAITDAQLQGLMSSAASQAPQPELHIRADGEIAYKRVASLMAEAANAGISKIGFITEPRKQKQ